MNPGSLDTRFPKKRAIITGGASGLGLATAEMLAPRGWSLGLLDRDAVRLAGAALSLRGKGSPYCEGYAVDTTDEQAVKTAIDAFGGWG